MFVAGEEWDNGKHTNLVSVIFKASRRLQGNTAQPLSTRTPTFDYPDGDRGLAS